MHADAPEVLAPMAGLGAVEEWIGRASATGYRSLVVVGTSNPAKWVEVLASVSGGDCALVATSSLRSEGPCRASASPAGVEKILGGEFAAAIIAVEGLLRPSIIAAAGETVRRSGFLALVTQPPDRWDPGPPGGRGLYRQYLARAIRECPIHLWIDGDTGRVVSTALRPPKPPEGWVGPESYRSREAIPRRLVQACRTWSQASALDALARLYKGLARGAIVRGDRGRGKSYVIGLSLAYAAWRRMLGRAAVVAPAPLSVQSLMSGLIRGLQVLGVRSFRIVRRDGQVLRVSAPWFRVSYEDPSSAEPAPLVIVDEAAAVGMARVRRLAWRSGRIMVSTTVHGYEGSGRSFAKLLPRVMPKPYMEVELVEPVRYLPGDPLEQWLYENFMLKAEPRGPPRLDGGSIKAVRLAPEDLASDTKLLRQVFSILAQAHYRNTPDDLLAMLESRHHRVYTLTLNGVPVAVASIIDESFPGDDRAGLALERLRFMSGFRGLELKSWRVSRIAVVESLQRRGLGSRLLDAVEADAMSAGVDVVTTLFSRHEVIPFWISNGYKPFYLSPRYNRVSGEKNVGLAKPLNEAGKRVVETASRALALRLVEAGSSVYRDVDAETLSILLKACEPLCRALRLEQWQERHLQAFLDGRAMADQTFDSVLEVARSALLACKSLYDRPAIVGVVARIVQGKPYNEVAHILGLGLEEAVKSVEGELRAIVSSMWSPGGRVVSCCQG